MPVLNRVHLLVAGPGLAAAGSSLEGCLTALLHTCHAFTKPQYAALLEPHISDVWATFFASFEAFTRSCEQLSIICSSPQTHLPPQASLASSPVQQSANPELDHHTVSDVNHVSDSEAGRSSSRRLLLLLSRCELMEQLLARLVPGFLAVLKSETMVQVGVTLPVVYKLPEWIWAAKPIAQSVVQPLATKALMLLVSDQCDLHWSISFCGVSGNIL